MSDIKFNFIQLIPELSEEYRNGKIQRKQNFVLYLVVLCVVISANTAVPYEDPSICYM